MVPPKRVIKIICAETKTWYKKPGAWIIQESEKVDFSHFAIISEFDVVYESVFPKSRKIRQFEWSFSYDVVRTYELHLDFDQYSLFIEKINNEVGKPYSIFQLIAIWVSQTLKIATNNIESWTLNGEKGLICTEYVARPISEILGYDFGMNLDCVGMDELESALKKICHRSY